MKRKRILTLQIKRDGFSKALKKWRNFDFHCVDFNFYYVITYDEKEGSIAGVRNIGKLNSAIDLLMDGYDAVCCESPDAFLLQYVMLKRGVRLMPFVIILTDTLKKVRDFCAWTKKKYHDDYYNIFLKNPGNYWLYSSASELKYYVEEGISKERLFYVPVSLYSQDAVLSDVKDDAKNMIVNWNDSLINEVKGAPVAGGDNSRDYETLVRAGKGLPCTIHIICDPRYHKIKNKTDNVKFHDVVPLNRFYQVLSAAKFIIIPLRRTSLVPGTSSIGLAIGFGKPVIVTNYDWLHDYVIPHYNGILVEPHDAEGMRKAILYLNENEQEIEKMGKNSLLLSHALDKIARKNFKAIFDTATTGNYLIQLPDGNAKQK